MEARCPSAGIIKYLNEQPFESVGIEGAQVTHVWTDDPSDAENVSAASLVPNVVDQPEDVIGEVDGVLIATDDGDDHVRRALPFVEAGVPVFVDKPLATNLPDLCQFVHWEQGGAALLSSSGMRYAKELVDLRGPSWRWLTGITAKTWEKYGIHLLEPILALLGPGFEQVRTERNHNSSFFHIVHRSGTSVTLAVVPDAVGSFGVFHAYGESEHRQIQVKDFYVAFRNQLLTAIHFFRTGESPFPFEQTIELMAIIIAGIRSGEEGGRVVTTAEILEEIGVKS
tara:strand:- start:16615 stop:17463 length:849 start_codon:yes stop_codon:yes gene_type:complete